jgi:hypothetical protein
MLLQINSARKGAREPRQTAKGLTGAGLAPARTRVSTPAPGGRHPELAGNRGNLQRLEVGTFSDGSATGAVEADQLHLAR